MFESMRSGSSINLAKHLRQWIVDRSVWVGALIVGLVVAYIEIGRRLSIAVPIPFLILLGIVVLVASLGGKRPGVAGAGVASIFIVYSTLISFGPATLTGGPVQAFLGIALMLVVGYFVGRTKDQNRSMINALEETHLELERQVAMRTAELLAANEQLNHEIEERIQAEKAVQQQEQLALVGQLAAGIAHDFNNVMAVILLYAQLLSLSPNLTEKEKKQLKTIFEEGQRAADLTTQIMDFGRQTVLDRQPFDLLPFMESFVELLRRTLPDDITIMLEHDQDNYFITADSGRIQQALMNLALNSRDAMPDGGQILIRLTQVTFQSEEQPPIPDLNGGAWARIIVTDNGNGISEESQNHLFEPFYTTKEPGKGTGLGLAQVYGIVKQHHGFISVVSEVDKGTTFAITLPMTDEEQSIDRNLQADSTVKGEGELILVVEDNNATRLALLAALESLNYSVKGAENGREALILLRRHRDEIALVISDVVMPEMGGIALLDAMVLENFTMPVMLLTGNSPVEELELVRSEGRADWYVKPIPLEMLGQIVASKLEVFLNN